MGSDVEAAGVILMLLWSHLEAVRPTFAQASAPSLLPQLSPASTNCQHFLKPGSTEFCQLRLSLGWLGCQVECYQALRLAPHMTLPLLSFRCHRRKDESSSFAIECRPRDVLLTYASCCSRSRTFRLLSQGHLYVAAVYADFCQCRQEYCDKYRLMDVFHQAPSAVDATVHPA